MWRTVFSWLGSVRTRGPGGQGPPDAAAAPSAQPQPSLARVGRLSLRPLPQPGHVPVRVLGGGVRHRQPRASSSFHSDLLVILSKLWSSVGFSSFLCKTEENKPVSCRLPVEPGRAVRSLPGDDWEQAQEQRGVPCCPSQVAARLLLLCMQSRELPAPGSLNPS